MLTMITTGKSFGSLKKVFICVCGIRFAQLQTIDGPNTNEYENSQNSYGTPLESNRSQTFTEASQSFTRQSQLNRDSKLFLFELFRRDHEEYNKVFLLEYLKSSECHRHYSIITNFQMGGMIMKLLVLCVPELIDKVSSTIVKSKLQVNTFDMRPDLNCDLLNSVVKVYVF